MSHARFVKIALLTVSAFLFLCFIGSFFLGPGVGDFSEPIINGYVYSDAGWYEKTIIYVYSGKEREQKEFPQEIIIDARVDEYRVEGDNLLVARRPREVYFEQDGVTNTRLLPICEYWMIDTKKHTMQKTIDAYGMHCK
jgi:hypothetical protein